MKSKPTPAEQGRFARMSREEKAEYDAYVAKHGRPPTFWACTFNGVPGGDGAKWANKQPRRPWHDWLDESGDG